MDRIPTRLVKRSAPREDSLTREVITHYGSVCACPGCGETRLSELTLDHIHAGGNAQRRALKRQGSSFYREVKRLIAQGQAPTDLQVLCQRCNLSKHDGSRCVLDHTRKPIALMAQWDTAHKDDAMLDDDASAMRDPNDALADEGLVQLSGRVKASTRKWIREQGLAIGEVIDRLVQDKCTGEATILSELREVRALITAIAAQPAAEPDSPPSTKPVPFELPAVQPWTTPEQWTAWNIFKAQWDAEHAIPLTPLPPRLPDPPKPAGWLDTLRRRRPADA